MIYLDEHLDENGVYNGPAEATEGVDTHDGVTPDIKSTGTLKHVTGDIDFNIMDTKEVPNLKVVIGRIDMAETDISILPVLKKCGAIYCDKIPLCPEIGHRTIFNFNSVPNGEKEWGEFKCYIEFLEEVRDTPTEELVPLRAAKPHLEYIIDFVLKGGRIVPKGITFDLLNGRKVLTLTGGVLGESYGLESLSSRFVK